MSPLWSGKNTKLENRQVNPSPTYNDFFLDSAQDPGKFTNSIKKYLPIKKHSIEEISLLASEKRNVVAGMTVEAALALPVFLFFLLSFGSVIEMIRLHGNMQLALWEVGREAAMYAYALEVSEEPKEDERFWAETAKTMLSSVYLKWKMVDILGEPYVDKSPVVGGVDGLVFLESNIVKPNGEMELVVTYGVESISNLIGFPYFRMANQYYGHAWTGYQLEQMGKEDIIVYLAENAEVYHLYSDCTHLKLTVRKIWEMELDSARNLYGARYNACEKCADGKMPSWLFVAAEGDCYHYVRECPGLKRTIYSVSLDAAEEFPLCSRCKDREDKNAE